MRLLLLAALASWTAGSAWADSHYLVGGCTASGWSAGEYNRSAVAMMNVSDNVWIWTGRLTIGDGDDGRFKIPNGPDGWDGYWAPAQGTVLTSEWSALSTDGAGDYKYCVAEEGIYKVTINTLTLQIKAEKLPEPSKDGDYYLISSVADYYWFAGAVNTTETQTLKARLTADLDFADGGFFPIASDKWKFKGEFDGAGHTIDHAVILDNDYSNIGLIRYATDRADVHDLIIGANSSFTGKAKVGGIIGFARDGGEVKLTNVINMAAVKATGGTDANAAGLVGCATDNTKITALNCANMGSVSGQDGQCSAFAGWTQGGTTFTNCWNSGAISNMENNCNLYRNTSGVAETNCFDASGNAAYTQGTKVDPATMATGEFCYMLNGSINGGENWYQNLGTETADACPVPFATHGKVYANGDLYCDGTSKGTAVFSNTEGSNRDAHSYGEWGFCTNVNGVGVTCDDIQPDFVTLLDGVYQISNAKELNWLAVWTDRKDATVNAVLTADINMSEVGNFPGLGSNAHNYTGTFDGQRHIISNMKMDWAREGVGLINRAANGAELKNVTMASNCSFKGDKAVAGLIGGIYGGGDVYIENCGNEAAVESTGMNAGGVCGVCFNGTILHLTNVYNVGTITGAAANESGSLSGWMQDAVIENCYSIAGYPSADNTYGFQQGNQFARGNNIKLTNCYDYGTGDWGQNNADWGGVFAAGAGKIAEVNESEMGRVFAALYDASDVWRLEFDGWVHPVLYDPAKMVLSENVPNRFVAGTADLTLKRTLVKDSWNTICLPFDLTTGDQQFLFGLGDYKVAELTGADGETLQFTSVTGTMTAGKAYLVKPVQNVTEKQMNGVTLKTGATTPSVQGGYAFTGIYEPTLIAEGDLFVADGDKLQPSNGEGKLKGFRAYFKKQGEGARATRFVIDGGISTGIITVDGTVMEEGSVYTLGGQRVSQPTKGLYIVNGKKQIVK